MTDPANPTILIIDGSSSYRLIIKNFLLALGHNKVFAYSSSEECIKAKILPDIIILDQNLGLGNQSGLEFLRSNKFKYPNTYFLFLSSCMDIEVAADSIRWGAHSFIFKSINGLERLVERFETIIKIEKKNQKNTLNLKLALCSLSLFSIIFIAAIILYNMQLI